MKLKDVITMLQERPEYLDEEVEFVVVTSDGRIIAIDLSTQAQAVKKALKLFGA